MGMTSVNVTLDIAYLLTCKRLWRAMNEGMFGAVDQLYKYLFFSILLLPINNSNFPNFPNIKVLKLKMALYKKEEKIIFSRSTNNCVIL